MKNIKKRLGMWAGLVAAILMIPFFGQMPWSAGDYLFAGVVLFGLATVYEVTTQNMKNKNHRIIIAIVVLTVLIGIWGWAVA